MTYFIGLATILPLVSRELASTTEGLTMITGKEVQTGRASKVASLEADNARLRKLAEELNTDVSELRAAVEMRLGTTRDRSSTSRASGERRRTPPPRMMKQFARRAGLAR